MRFFIESADPKEIRACAEQGLVDGVTTTAPLLAAAAAASGREPGALVAHLCSLVDGPVSVEVVAEDREGMVREARELARLAPNIVVTLPLSAEGLEALRRCALERITTNVTHCFDPMQALAAAQAGAGFISPSIARPEGASALGHAAQDAPLDGGDLVRKIVALYRTYGLKTAVLVASVRNPNHIVDAALAGAVIASVPYAVLQQLATHPPDEIAIGDRAAGTKVAK